jgi:8-oxo-dGTP pyrophosphatase MutT (NUDIX family)
MSDKPTSCGVLLLNPRRELLLCHATGATHWDIPKGLPDPGESPSQTAQRETLEETGLCLLPERLLDLGVFAYLRTKNLHLFATGMAAIDPSTCVCTSMFRDFRGRMVPEADVFEWTAFDRVSERCAKGMTAVLTHKLSLEEVWARVQAMPAPG